MQAKLPAICKWIYPRCDGRLPAIPGNSVWNCRFFACDCAGIFSCVWQVVLPAILVYLPANCMYFCLQKQAFLNASRGQNLMSSTNEITSRIPVVLRWIYMRLQAICVYSARGGCCIDAGRFICFYMYSACNAGKLHVGISYKRSEDKVTCVFR